MRKESGFTLLELVIALVLFAFIVIEVLADRQDSLILSANAKTKQTLNYLAQSKVDQIRYDPEQFAESDSGNFEELNSDFQSFDEFTWELELKRVVVIGSSDETDDEFLYAEDEDNQDEPLQDAQGNNVPPRYVRRLTLTVRFEPGTVRPVEIVTYIPPVPDEEEEP